jgi:hypothetical protein
MKSINVLFLSLFLLSHIVNSISLNKSNLKLLNNKLKEKHLNNLSFIQTYVKTLSDDKLFDEHNDIIENQIKSYFKKIHSNIDELNKE